MFEERGKGWYLRLAQQPDWYADSTRHDVFLGEA
jgi:hypothetical protein